MAKAKTVRLWWWRDGIDFHKPYWIGKGLEVWDGPVDWPLELCPRGRRLFGQIIGIQPPRGKTLLELEVKGRDVRLVEKHQPPKGE